MRASLGVPTVLARRIRVAVERRRARIIYPRVYTLARHTPALTRVMMDAMTPLPPSNNSPSGSPGVVSDPVSPVGGR